MKVTRQLLVLAIAASLLAGCGSLKKLTGQRNDTVLPGERENILAEDQQVNPKISKKGEADADTATACDPNIDVNCEQPVDQEAGGADIQ